MGFYLLLNILFTFNQNNAAADVVKVQAKGKNGSYSFSVTISSPDQGCQQYADWWEVISDNGDLIYRRILLHSHVKEQPFSRSGGPIKINSEQNIWIRVHMNNSGYGGKALYGSVKNGFNSKKNPEGFDDNLDTKAPLPNGCSY